MIELDVRDKVHYTSIMFDDKSCPVLRSQFKDIPYVTVRMWDGEWKVQPLFFANRYFLRFHTESTVWEVNYNKARFLGLFKSNWKIKFRRHA